MCRGNMKCVHNFVRRHFLKYGCINLDGWASLVHREPVMIVTKTFECHFKEVGEEEGTADLIGAFKVAKFLSSNARDLCSFLLIVL